MIRFEKSISADNGEDVRSLPIDVEENDGNKLCCQGNILALFLVKKASVWIYQV